MTQQLHLPSDFPQSTIAMSNGEHDVEVGVAQHKDPIEAMSTQYEGNDHSWKPDEDTESKSISSDDDNEEFAADGMVAVRHEDPTAGGGGMCSIGRGLKEDFQARLLPYYASDWARPKSFLTVTNATIFAFVVQIIPALIFADLLERQTQGHLGVAETLLSTAVMGIIYAIAAGQPLVILGVTGPVAILLGTFTGLMEQFNAEFFAFFFWSCIWAGLLHVVASSVGMVNLVWKVTPFTSQIFELFNTIAFIYSSLRDLFVPLKLMDGNVPAEVRSSAYAALAIGFVTFSIAWSLHFAETWVFLTRPMRVFLTSYNMLIALIIGTVLSYLPGIDQTERYDSLGIRRVSRILPVSPWDWQPTWDRQWLASPMDGIDTVGIFAAMIPGLMLFLLFMMDHNVSSILTQSPKFNLKKPSAYHWDFFVLGITFIPCALLGLPPGNALIPQAPLYARALATREYQQDKDGNKHEVVTHVEEQRWSALAQALLMFLALSAFPVLAMIPKGGLYGLFLYLGVGALHGNEIWERLSFMFMVEERRPGVPVVKFVNWPTVKWYTAIQLAIAIMIWAVAEFAPVGFVYPLLLTLLVPFRSFVVGRLFHQNDLYHLDPYGETEQDFHDEQRVIRQAEHRGQYWDEEECLFPTRAEFRGGGFLSESASSELRLRKASHCSRTHGIGETKSCVSQCPPRSDTSSVKAAPTHSRKGSDVSTFARMMSFASDGVGEGAPPARSRKGSDNVPAFARMMSIASDAPSEGTQGGTPPRLSTEAVDGLCNVPLTSSAISAPPQVDWEVAATSRRSTIAEIAGRKSNSLVAGHLRVGKHESGDDG